MFGVKTRWISQHLPTWNTRARCRKTQREIFLERMDGLTPWGQLEERIRPFYPKAGRGRRPYESESNKRPTGDEKRETPVFGVFPLASSSRLMRSGDLALGGLFRFPDRR